MTKSWELLQTMARTVFFIIYFAFSSAFAGIIEYKVQPNDTLSEVLKKFGYGPSYKALLPVINEVVRLNPSVFDNNSALQIYPNTHIKLPIASSIGKVNSIEGDTFVIRDNKKTKVSKNFSLMAKDKIVTDIGSLAKVELLDKTQFELGASSAIEIIDFKLANKKADGAGALFVRFNKGVTKTITGAVSKLTKQNYIFKSILSAAIGIRGTNFTVRNCLDKASCGERYGVAVGVEDGGIRFSNKVGAVELNKNEYTSINSATEKPKRKPLPVGFFELKTPTKQAQPEQTYLEQKMKELEAKFQ